MPTKKFSKFLTKCYYPHLEKISHLSLSSLPNNTNIEFFYPVEINAILYALICHIDEIIKAAYPKYENSMSDIFGDLQFRTYHRKRSDLFFRIMERSGFYIDILNGTKVIQAEWFSNHSKPFPHDPLLCCVGAYTDIVFNPARASNYDHPLKIFTRGITDIFAFKSETAVPLLEEFTSFYYDTLLFGYKIAKKEK